jgi:hypothetical protein
VARYVSTDITALQCSVALLAIELMESCDNVLIRFIDNYSRGFGYSAQIV